MADRFDQLTGEFNAGNPVVLVDDNKSSGEAAIVCKAEYAEPGVVNLMATYAKGIVSVGITADMAVRAGLQLQAPPVPDGGKPTRTYTVSIDAEETTTGISAYERSLSIKKLAATGSAQGFKQPGHIFPVVGHPCGVYGNVSVIEGALVLARLCKGTGMTAICDILDSDGRMADGEYAQQLAGSLNLPVLNLSEVVRRQLLVDGLLDGRTTTEVVIDQYLVIFFSYRCGDRLLQVGVKGPPERVKQSVRELVNWLDGMVPTPAVPVHPPNFADSLAEGCKRLSDPQQHVVLFAVGDDAWPASLTRIAYLLILADVERELGMMEPVGVPQTVVKNN